MITEEEKVEKIKQSFFEYAKEHELSAFDTSNYFARQIIPDESFSDESFFLKRTVIDDLIKSGDMVVDSGKWVIKNLDFLTFKNKNIG